MGYIYVTEKRKIKQKYINYGGVYMHIFKKIFTILAIIFGSLGLMNIVSTDVALLASGDISHLLSGENDQSQSDRNNQCISFSFL